MSGVIHLQNNSDCEDVIVHLMPCNIDYNGPAEVGRYFNSCIKTDKGASKGSFRGRCILGKTVSMPSGYKGVITNEKNAIFSDAQSRKLEVTKSFDKMTYWNLETRPSQNDAIMNAFDWASVASILHAPICKEEMKSEE